MSNYDQKRGARAQRYLNRAKRARNESNRAYEASNAAVEHIPLGQPILVGHHSERRHRRAIEKSHNAMRKSISLENKAKEFERRAEAALNNKAIFSDDPNAAEKLAEKIERLEQRQELMKKANVLVRKSDAEGLLNLGFSESNVQKLLKGDYIGRRGFPSYELTNNNANIRRLKQRLKHLEKQVRRETSEIQIETVRIVDNTQENRTQIVFPDKPSESCRRELKSRGFRWSPNAGAWQRHLSADAFYWAKVIVQKYYSKQD
jgi:hypothetical protein